MSWNVFIVNVVYDDNSPVENAKVVYNFNQQTQYYTGYTGADGLLKIVAEGAQTAYTASTIFAFDEELLLESRANNITINDGYTYTFMLDCSDVGLTFRVSTLIVDYLYYSLSINDYPIVYQYKIYYKNSQGNYVLQTTGTKNHEVLSLENNRLPTTSVKIELINNEYYGSPFIRTFDYSDNGSGGRVVVRTLKTSYEIRIPDINDTIDWIERDRTLIGCDVTFYGYDSNNELLYSATTTSTNPTLVNVDVLSNYSVLPNVSNTMYNLKKPQNNEISVSKNHYNDYISNFFLSGNTDVEFFFIESGKTINDPVILEREPNVCMVNKDLYDYLVSLTSLSPNFNTVYESERVGVSDMWFTYLWSNSIKQYLPPEYQSMNPDTVENFKTLFVNQLSTTTVSTLYTYPEYLESANYRLDQHHGYVWDRCFIPEEKEIVENCLTFTAINNVCDISFNYVPGPRTLFNFEYSLDSGNTWNAYSFQNGIGQTITLSPGGNTSIKFRRALSNTGTTLSTDYYTYYYFSITGMCNATGCVHSLLDGYGLSTTEFTSIGCFARLFANCSGLLTAPELPATSLTDYCYFAMFAGCTSLTEAPELPASSLTESCYNSMFAHCTSLTTPPDLPATELADSCYSQMFYNCTSLTTAPLLPSMILADNCYNNMFAGCESLTNVQYYLLAEELADSCYNAMFQDCYSLTTAPLLPATALTNNCYSGMFFGCSSLTNVQSALPATTLAQNCYLNMFNGCKSLTTAPTLPAMTLADSCYRGMFQECSSLVSVQASLPAASACQYCYADMFSNCTSLITPPVVPATTLAENCYQNMFANCTSLTSTTYFPATTMKEYCYSGMFYGCTSLTNARTLSAATVLSESCFEGMFYGCTSLSTTPTISRSPGMQKNCFKNMFYGCTSITTMPYTGSSFPWQSHAYGCYEGMFENCTSLVNTPPIIFGYNARDYCFKRMFAGCSSILNPITLYANNLGSLSGVCESMFEGCTRLMSGKTADSLVIGPNCYKNMFKNCGKLMYIEAKFTGTTSGSFTIQNSSAYTYDWVSGVANVGTFYHKNGTPGTPAGYSTNWIPNGWTASLLA